MKKALLILLSSFILIVSGCGNVEQNKPPLSSTDGSNDTSVTTEAKPSESTTVTSVPAAAESSDDEDTEKTEDIKTEKPEDTAPESSETEKPEDSGTEKPEDSDAPTTLPTGYGEKIVSLAESLIGTPFVFGGDSPEEGFDGSGLIYYVLRESGYISCPRLIRDQVEWAENVGFNEIKPGDVLFYALEEGGDKAEFGGIYIGDGKIIYSPYEGETVKTANITTGYWTKRFVTAISL